MATIKAQKMSIKTVIVLTLALLVAVIIIAFAIPELTTMFINIEDVGSSVTEQSEQLDLNLSIGGE